MVSEVKNSFNNNESRQKLNFFFFNFTQKKCYPSRMSPSLIETRSRLMTDFKSHDHDELMHSQSS